MARRARAKLSAAVVFIDAILQADRKAPRKQRHTAHRIWCGLRAELAQVAVAESTVRAYVRKRKREFEFQKVPHIPAVLIRHLAEGDYLKRSEPVVLLGETGTGKTPLATGLAVAACRQRERVRVTTAAQLVNELTEAKHKSELNRVTNRWTRYKLIVIDEMAYVTMSEAAAELLFPVIAGRAERAAMIVSEWATMFPNARLCKAMLDRLTDQAHIIETGIESYRFRRTLAKKGSKASN